MGRFPRREGTRRPRPDESGAAMKGELRKSQQDVTLVELYQSLKLDFDRLHDPACGAGCRVLMPTTQDPGRAKANWTLEAPAAWPEKCRTLLSILVRDHQARFDLQDERPT
jgi:hypothetical protein